MRASLFATIVMAPAAIAGPAAAADVLAKSKIETVTVFPQGAEVTRVAKVRIEKGDHTIVLNELPGQTLGSSIRVEGKASARLVIGSVDNRRTHITSQDQANLQANRQRIEGEIEKLRDARVVLDHLAHRHLARAVAVAFGRLAKAIVGGLGHLAACADLVEQAVAERDQSRAHEQKHAQHHDAVAHGHVQQGHEPFWKHRAADKKNGCQDEKGQNGAIELHILRTSAPLNSPLGRRISTTAMTK